MRVVFFGTPDFAVKVLESVISSKHEVVAVVTQPDRRVGRHAELMFSAVKKCALKHNIPVLQYEKVSREGVEDLKALNADIFVSCAYGQILSEEVLNITKNGVINVHASLLPKYRGASPIQHAILNGETETGVTIMKTELSLDSGDIIIAEKIQILRDETADELFERLSVLGAKLVVVALDNIENGTAKFTPQNHSEATFCKQIAKQDALIDFSKNDTMLFNFVRGMYSWPCAYTYLNGKILKIIKLKPKKCNIEIPQDNIGKVVYADKNNGLVVGCGNGFVEICELQLEGCKRMSSKDFLLGRKINAGDRLGKC